MLDMLRNSMGARRNPATHIITTAGVKKDTQAFEYRQGAIYELLHGESTNGGLPSERKFTFIFCMEPGADVEDRSKWLQANPSALEKECPLFSIESLTEVYDRLRSTESKIQFYATRIGAWQDKKSMEFIDQETFKNAMYPAATPLDASDKILDLIQTKRGKMIVTLGIDSSFNNDFTSLCLLALDLSSKTPQMYTDFWIFCTRQKIQDGLAKTTHKNLSVLRKTRN